MTQLSDNLAANTVQNTTPNAIPNTISLLYLRQLIPLSLYWISEQDVRARRIARYRMYYEGDHDAKLSPQMQELLRVKDSDDGFALNLMAKVVDTMADRCIVQGIEGITDTNSNDKTLVNEPTKWAQGVMEYNHFDALQGEVTTGTITDGDGYLLPDWHKEAQQVRWTHEEAFDGQSGMLMIYPSPHINTPVAAVKIWQIEGEPNGNVDTIVTRINIYYPNRVEKYKSDSLGAFQPFGDDYKQEWLMPNGDPIGLPVVHFRNGGRRNYGISTLRNALPPQNALNRFNYSAVMAAELTAFSVYISRGFPPPSSLVPGMILAINEGGMDSNAVADFTKLLPSEIKPILEMIDAQRRLISEITNTPSPDLAAGSGSNKSGEYLKQLEVGLIGKCQRFMTHAGQSWERVMELTWRIQSAFGKVQPPAYKRWFCRWRSPEIRNASEVVTNAVALQPTWGQRQTLRAVAPIYDLNEESIAKIIEESQADIAKAQAMQAPLTQTGQTPPITTIQGSKLPTAQALSTDHLTEQHMANLFDQYHGMKTAAMA